MQNSPPSSKPSRSVLMMSGASRSTQGPFDFITRQQESGSKSRAPLRAMTLQQRLLEEERRLAAQTSPQHEQCPRPCTRRAVEEGEGGEGTLERKMRLGQLLDDDEVEELKKRAAAQEVATDVVAGVMDGAAEAVVTAPARPCRLVPAPGSSPASSPAFGRAPPPHLPPRPAPQRDLQLFRENLRTDMASLRSRHVRQPTRMEPRPPPPPPPKAPPAPAYRAAPSHRAAPKLSGANEAQPETPPSSPPVRATSPTDIYAEPWKTSLGATAEPTSRVRLNSVRGAAEPELARKLFCLPPPYIAA